MTRPIDGDGPGGTTEIKAGHRLVIKHPVGYTSIPLAKQASGWLNNFPVGGQAPGFVSVLKIPRRLNKHPDG